MMHKCLICGKEYKNKIALYTHVSQYEHVCIKDYIDKYEEPYFHKCPYCDKERKWRGKKHYANTCGSKECRRKHEIDTLKERYGVTHNLSVPEVQEHIKHQNIIRYGKEWFFETDLFSEKRSKTFRSHYDCLWPGQSLDIIKRKTHKFYFNGIGFDSMPEMQYYKENYQLHAIVPHPCILKYEHNRKTHKYVPDFSVDGRLVEIKGKCFLKSDGTWQNPYNHSLDDLYEAKHQCAIKNNVEIIYV